MVSYPETSNDPCFLPPVVGSGDGRVGNPTSLKMPSGRVGNCELLHQPNNSS